MRKWRMLVGMVVAMLAVGQLGAASASTLAVQVIAFTPPVLPEGLTVDRHGNIHVGILTTGEIRTVSADRTTTTTLGTVPVGKGLLTGLTTDRGGNVYAALPSFDPATHGVWQVRPDGSARRFAALPADGLPNSLHFDSRGDLYVSDSFLATVWRITSNGVVQPWVQSSLLAGGVASQQPTGLSVGANGLAFDRNGDLYVNVTDFGRIVRVPARAGGVAGAPEIFVQSSELVGADDLTFDEQGGLFVAVNRQNKIVWIGPNAMPVTVATQADGLDFPASLAFGERGLDRGTLYVTNLAFLSLATGGTPRPSLMAIPLNVRGLSYWASESGTRQEGR
ncbi:MAG: hypothetical protein HY329_05135 [Chloroflexi bacterium]|nr:hypothetical protein [Chloroflexota bacterium]